MLMIDFSLGDGNYTLPSQSVIRVIPRVELSNLKGAPFYVAGLCNLRGEAIPVVDLTRWVTGEVSADRLNTRIIIIKVSIMEKMRKVGLVVERALRTNRRKIEEFESSGLASSEFPFLGGVVHEGNQTRRLLLLEPLARVLELELFTGMV